MNIEKQRTNRWGKVGKVVLLFVVLLVCIYAVVAKLTGISDAAANYEKNRDVAKQAGLWFTDEEAVKRFSGSYDDNGMPILGELLAVVYKMSHGVSPDEFNKNCHENWTTVEPFMPRLRQAVAKPVILGKFDPKHPYGFDKDYWILSHLVRIMVKETEYKARKGEISKAQDLLLLTASLVKHFRDRPGYPGSWISLADEIENLIKDLIPQVGRDAKWVDTFSQTLDLLGDTPDLHEVVKYQHWTALRDAEMYLGLTGSLEELGFKKEDSVPVEYTAGKLFPLYAKANLSRLHEAYVTVVNGLPANPEQFLHVASAFKQAKLGLPLDQSYRMTQIAGPNASWYYGDFITECVQRNALRQAIEFLRSGSDPGKGLQLKSPRDMDIDGLPLRLVHERGGWILYSVGSNRRDEHSAPPPMGIDDFVIHLSSKSIYPNESKREKRQHIGTRALD